MGPKINIQPETNWINIQTLEMHTGGEPLRIITGGLPEIPGKTILKKREFFKENYDHIRTATMWEPRGHADMYGAILTEPVTPDGDFGVFFLHNEGYSTMCGHGILALTRYVLEAGLVEKTGLHREIKIDTPSGRILSSATYKSGKLKELSFQNVPSFVFLENELLDVPGIGRINIDMAFGGAFYAFCDAKNLGLNLDSTDYLKLLDYGRRIKRAVVNNFTPKHPEYPELSFLYGVIFTGDPYNYKNHSRNVCIFADRELDRSPTGTGMSARAAIHYAKGELKVGERIRVESILGSTMDVEIKKLVDYGSRQAVIPEVFGNSWYTGRNEIWIDPDDPFANGFIFR